MKISRPLRFACCLLMSALMSNAPAIAFAKSDMIPTAKVVEKLSRSEAENDLRRHLNADDVRRIMAENGVSEEEVDARIANLSEQEMRELSGQLEEARAGGNILVTVLLILLIVFLVKRI